MTDASADLGARGTDGDRNPGLPDSRPFMAVVTAIDGRSRDSTSASTWAPCCFTRDILESVLATLRPLYEAGLAHAEVVGMKDPELLEPQLAPTLRASEVAGLPNFLAYVRSANEAANVPFSIRTRPPSTAARDGELGDVIRELSRYEFGRRRELVDAEIHAGLETLRGDE